MSYLWGNVDSSPVNHKVQNIVYSIFVDFLKCKMAILLATS